MDIILKYKKIILVAGFALIVFFLGYGIYFLFFKPLAPAPVTGDPDLTEPIGGLPEAATGTPQLAGPDEPGPFPFEETPDEIPSRVAQGGLTEVTELNTAPALAPILAGDGSSVQYYDRQDGRFYRIDQGGEAVTLSDRVFHQVENIVWNPGKQSAILEYPDGAKIYYDFNAARQVSLPKHWQDFDFSPDGSQVVMKSMGLDPGNRWLAVSTPDGARVKAIEPIGLNDGIVFPAWSPNSQIIAMYTRGLDFDRQEVFFLGQNNENFKSTIIEGRGFQPKWSPTQGKLLYSAYSSKTDMKPALWIVNATGEEIGTGRKNLNTETWAEKCVFANENELFCAVPENLQAGAGLFPELAENTRDNIYKIDINTGLKQLIARPDGVYNMSSLIVSEDGYYLYFTDATTGRLNKIILK